MRKERINCWLSYLGQGEQHFILFIPLLIIFCVFTEYSPITCSIYKRAPVHKPIPIMTENIKTVPQ